jgi:hypothetical protein
MVLFNKLKETTKDSPERARLFYPGNAAIRDALDALEDFLSRTDLERRVFHGPRKLFRQVPAEFEAAWKEYDVKWRFRRIPRPATPLEELILSPDETPSPPPDPCPPYEYVEPQAPAGQREAEVPDPEHEDSFDPIRHDGGAALELGIDYLWDQIDPHQRDEIGTNSSRIGCGACPSSEFLRQRAG